MSAGVLLFLELLKIACWVFAAFCWYKVGKSRARLEVFSKIKALCKEGLPGPYYQCLHDLLLLLDPEKPKKAKKEKKPKAPKPDKSFFSSTSKCCDAFINADQTCSKCQKQCTPVLFFQNG